MARKAKTNIDIAPKGSTGFAPVAIAKEHDTAGLTFDEWRERIKEKSLPVMSADRDRTSDSEALSAIYRAVAVALEPYLKDNLNWAEPPFEVGAQRPSMSRSKVRELLSSIVSRAKECKPLSQTQLLILLPDAMRYLYEEEDVYMFFDEIEEAQQTEEAIRSGLKGFHALTSDRKEYWTRYMTVEVAEKLMSVTQECVYKDLDDYESTITGFSSRLTPLDRAGMAFKYGASKCNEDNYRQLALQGLAKCLGSINPAEYRWVEPLEDFRSRAWSILEEVRLKIEQASVPSLPTPVFSRFPMLEMAITSDDVEELRSCIATRDLNLLQAIMRRRNLPAGISRECDHMMGKIERGES